MRYRVLVVMMVVVWGGCQAINSPRSEGSRAAAMQIERSAPDVMKRYNSFYIGDIQVYTVEGDYLYRVNDREVEILAEDFRRKLIESLGSHHSTIPQPTRNTAVIKVALTDVSTTYAAFQLVPGIVVPNAMRGGASIEATVLDSVSKQPVLKMKDSRAGQRQGYFSGLGKWDGTKKAFDEWASMLAHAVSN